MFPNSIETSPSDNSRHSKGILRLISITLRDCQNNYSSLLKSFRVENILKNVMLQDFMTNILMHIKQFTEAFQ